jgi:hypothetical protein
LKKKEREWLDLAPSLICAPTKERRVRARIFLNVITRVQEKDASLQRPRKLLSQLDHQLLFSQPSYQLHGLVYQLVAYASSDFSPLFVASVLLFDPFHRTRF